MGIWTTRRGLRRAAAIVGASALLSGLLVSATSSAGVLAATSLPVYGVIQEGLTKDQGSQLAKMYNVSATTQPDGSFTFADATRFEQVPSIRGATGKDKQGRPTVAQSLDMAALSRLKPLDNATALARGTPLLRFGGSGGDLTAQPTVSHAQLVVADKSGRTTNTFALDTSVTYQLHLGSLPIIGGGSKLRLSFAGDGSVTQLSDMGRQFVRGRTMPIISAAQAVAACQTLYGPQVRQASPTLAYEAPALTAKNASGKGTVATLFPQYTCQPIGPHGVEAGRLIPAVAGSGPTAKVTATRVGNSVRASVLSVAGGTAPYAYSWSSSTTVLPAGSKSGTSVSYTRSPRVPTPGETLTLAITDANGESATASLTMAADGTVTATSLPGGGGLAVLSSVGIEQTVDEWQCAQDSSDGFHNVMASHGVAVPFDWRGANAWENDFEDPASGGSDHSWIDGVDASWYTGHGWSGGFTFKGNNDTTSVTPSEISWGDNRVDWVQLESCDVLADTTNTNDYFSRWGPTLDGLHVMNGFHTVASCVGGGTGGDFASYLFPYTFLGITLRPALPVRTAWAAMAMDKEPSGTVFRSMGPLGAGFVTNIGDYFWGQGPVGPDIFASGEIGYWAIAGTV